MLKMRTNIASSTNFRKGRNGNKIKFIVMHYTANDGDTAQNNADYFHNTKYLNASAHYFVDEYGIYHSVLDEDTAWHCGGVIESSHHPYKGICMNVNSIGVEICSRKNYNTKHYYFKQKAIDNAIELVKYLMKCYSIPVENVIRHYDVTGKNCPEPWVYDSKQFESFKQALIKKEEKPVTYEEWKAFQARYEKEKANEKASDYAKDSVAKAVKHGISDGSAPKANCTREQVLTMLDRAGVL